ncbi:MAG TPA: peptidoglycan-binding protein [Pyrinomonadaceae bacterium]|jgi:peptidoglycan hydrolase-like protein with peptidoglycan-binding domain|nr:peptidoglycan-binding protein [Pyrinomonadaceae bacterium]
MADGIRIFGRSELAVFGADYDARAFEPECGPAGFLSETPNEAVRTARLAEFQDRDAQLAYLYRARFEQEGDTPATDLRRGDRGPQVLGLQQTLVRLGHLSAAALATGPGLFGARTERALKEFQRANGLIESGVYDGPTRTAVEAITGGVRRGARGELVERLQRRLVELNYLTPQQMASGPGIFGRQTENAVRQFQADHGIPQTGAMGLLTYRALRTASPRGTGGGGGGGDLRLSAQIREGASRTRQAVSSPVLGDFTVTASFMDPDGHGYKRNGAYAIFSSDPQRIVRIEPSRVNLGIDYVTPDGRIRNWFAGTVERATYEPNGYGYRVQIRTDLTYRYQGRDYPVYAHYAHAAQAFNLRGGDRVEPGQDIGRMGNTGASQGAHVDFRTWIVLDDGRRVDISPNLLVNRRRNTTTNTTGGVQAPVGPTRTEPRNRPAGDLTLGVNERYRDALLLAERRTGIDAAALAGLINAEASRDRDGRWIANSFNPQSHAAGLTQFLPSTWMGRATTAGTYVNELAVERGYVRRERNGGFTVLNRQAVLDLRNDPTASIVSAAEYGRENLRSLEGYGLLPENLTDDQRARYMYYAHHEGLAGAVRLLTDSRNVTEDAARRALTLGLNSRTAAAARARQHGSYAAAFRVWTEQRARYLFPSQLDGSRASQRLIYRYVTQHGDYEHGYRAWLENYTARQVRPENYRR